MAPISIDEFLSKLEHVKKSGSGYTARCPSHEDKQSSLSIKDDNGKILVHCHAGCTFSDIVAALGLDPKSLFPQDTNKQESRLVSAYDYTDISGKLKYQSCRYSPKKFVQRRPDPDHKGKWIYNLKGVSPLPFHLDKAIDAVKAGKTVFIPEGEKDVINLEKIGLTATCNSGGAGKWHKEFSQYFSSANIALIADNDEPGREHVNKVAAMLSKVTSAVFVVNLDGLQEKGDVSDWIKHGGTRERLIEIAQNSPLWTPQIPETIPAKTESVPPVDVQHTPFKILGFNDGYFYYMPDESLQLCRMNADQHTQACLIALSPLTWWEQAFPSKTGIDWNAAKNFLFRRSTMKGIYDPKKLRGCGTWFDNGRVVQHNGNVLIVDGVATKIEDFNTNYIYNASYPIESSQSEPLLNEAASHFLKTCKMPSWDKAISGTLLAGWCVVAPICGALYWRPHIWLTGASGTGKAQPHSAEILTPSGWRTMGELSVGDYVTTPDNGYGKIKNVFPQGKVPVYKFTFKDGRSTRATEDHLWKVRSNGDWRIKTTKELIEIVDRKSNASNMTAIQVPDPVTVSGNNKTRLLLHPYVLGALLGDGHFGKEIRLSSYDDFIINKVKKLTPDGITFYPTNKVHDFRMGDLSKYGRKSRLLIKELKLLGTRSDTKFIPDDYLNASIENRINLLQGLMDTDGTISKGHISYCTVSEKLANNVVYIVRSLGGIAKISTRIPSYTHNGEKRKGKLAYNISIRFKKQSIAFSLPRKVQNTSNDNQYSDCLYLQIKTIEPDGEEECSCIMIDHPDRLYITDDFVVTHNTWLIDNIVKPALGHTSMRAQSNTTEAGIRQWLGINAFPVLLDESEGEDRRARDRLQNVIELMRQASSESGAPIVKGSAHGNAVEFKIRSCFCLSSIGVNINQKADASRITVLSLSRPHKNDVVDMFDTLKEQIKIVSQEYCAGLRSRSIKLIPVILTNSKVFGRAIAEKFGDQRIGDQFGVLIAGAYSLTSDKIISHENAVKWIEKQDWTEQSSIEDISDEERCLNRILEYNLTFLVETMRIERTVSEILDSDEPSTAARQALERMGLKINESEAGREIVISDSHSGIQKILRNSEHEKNWGRILKRFKGSASKTSIRFNGKPQRATSIPVANIFNT